jgi:hypothetical protein
LIGCDITSFFIGDFQSATFGGKNTALAKKYVKLAILHLCVGSSSKHLFRKTHKFSGNRVDEAWNLSIPNSLIQTESKKVGLRSLAQKLKKLQHLEVQN